MQGYKFNILRLFHAVPQGCLRFVIVAFPDHTHLLFLIGSRSGDIFNEHPSYLVCTMYISSNIPLQCICGLFRYTDNVNAKITCI